MARITKKERHENLHEEALLQFDDIQSSTREERLQCLEDRRFCSISGAQWEGNLEEQFNNKPRFEINKIQLAVLRIINEYRNNRITVNFVSKDGSKDDKLAETCNLLFRSDEQNSTADEAYDNCFEEGTTGGFGAFRLRTIYECEYDEDNDQQRICMEPIYDADSSVFFDLDAKKQDKSDAKRCFVITAMTRDSYISEYNDDPSSWPKEIHQYQFDWATPDMVYIAELYCIEEASELIRIFENIKGEEERYSETEFSDDEDLEAMLKGIGTIEVDQKRVKRRKVHKYIMGGSGIIKDCGYIAGTEIPVIPYYGKRWFIDNIERCMGHVRMAKDAQRLYNMQLSKLGEICAISTVEKPLFTPEQIAGFEQMWAEDNLKNYPFLLLNPVTGTGPNDGEILAGPIGYTKSPQVPPALAGMVDITDKDIKDLLGNQESGEQMQPNISGKAIELIQTRLDMQTFIYMSNMAKSIKRAGEVWLSMAREIMVEPGRKMKGIGSQGQMSSVELCKPMMNKDTGKIEYQNDVRNAKFDVTSDVGPSSSSKRSATVRSLMGMMSITQDPETQQVLGAMAMMNMEGEGLADVNNFFRKKLVHMGAVEPTDEERQDMKEELEQNKDQKDPQSTYLEAEAAKSNALAKKAYADTGYTVARTEETRADTMETLAGIERNERKEALDTVEKLQKVTQDSQIRQPPSRV